MWARTIRAASIFVFSALAIACTVPPTPSSEQDDTALSRSPVDALVASEDVEGYARAEEPREFVFPQDHGPHPDFQTEWWYVTGNVETAEGRRFGLQWTIFRRALTPDMAPRSSEWASRQIYMGHMALADTQNKRHLSAERITRGAAGLAGAQIRPFKVWLEDWRASSTAPEEIWPMRLESRHASAEGQFALDLELEPEKPHVLQGDRGLSWKHERGASFYYSFTRLSAHGTVELDGESFEVRGEAWLDREWSTSTLDKEQAGWDWFSIQLADGREVMYYQLRQKDGSAHAMSAGVLVDEAGAKTPLERAEVELDVLRRWRSPRSGGEYPIRWRLKVPEHGLDLEVVPLFEDQELEISFRYWEGAVDVREPSGKTIGRGYVELVGYADGGV